jgi:hypothetical protein
VLIYTAPSRASKMLESIPSAELVTQETDYRSLRVLNVTRADGGYRVLVTSMAACMRGFDFLGKENGLTLIIDSSFESMREAYQGLARVGRFGEKCQRLITHGTELVDSALKMELSRRLLDF